MDEIDFPRSRRKRLTLRRFFRDVAASLIASGLATAMFSQGSAPSGGTGSVALFASAPAVSPSGKIADRFGTNSDESMPGPISPSTLLFRDVAIAALTVEPSKADFVEDGTGQKNRPDKLSAPRQRQVIALSRPLPPVRPTPVAIAAGETQPNGSAASMLGTFPNLLPSWSTKVALSKVASIGGALWDEIAPTMR